MSARKFSILLLAVLMAGTIDVRARAEEACCCARCGCAAPCQKVCRLECGEKKVEVICWGCKREDFCVPFKSERGCEHCQTVCDTCGDAADPQVCSKPKNFVWYDWIPGCGSVHTRTKLMRRVDTVTVPSYKWVVEDLCPGCAANTAASQPGTIVYAPPAESTAPAADEEKSIFSTVRLPKFTSK